MTEVVVRFTVAGHEQPPPELAGLLVGMSLRDPLTWTDEEKAPVLRWVAGRLERRYVGQKLEPGTVQAMGVEATSYLAGRLQPGVRVEAQVYDAGEWLRPRLGVRVGFAVAGAGGAA